MKSWKFDDQRPYLFVSYKSEDKDSVEGCIENLYKKGINIWYDADLTAGRLWDEEAKLKIRDCGCKGVIFFASKKALTSGNVKLELDTAKEYEKKIIPINFEHKSFKKLCYEDILGECNKEAPQLFDIAKEIVEKHLPENLTYLVWKQRGFYDELIKSLKRNVKDFDKYFMGIMFGGKIGWLRCDGKILLADGRIAEEGDLEGERVWLLNDGTYLCENGFSDIYDMEKWNQAQDALFSLDGDE